MKKIMTFVGRMFLPAITFITFTCVYSCKKDVHEDASATPISKTNNLRSASAVSSDGVANLLDDWWANYAVYKNIQYTNSVTPNLNANLNRDYAVSMLHYSLNVAMVNVDSTYQDVTTDSVFYNYTAPPDNPVLLKRDVCIAFDNIKDQIKAKLQNTELIEKAINRITLTDLSVTENSLNLKVNFDATGGTLIATKETSTGTNVEASFFASNSVIPWVSQMTAPAPHPISGLSLTDKYWTFLMDGNDYGLYETTGAQCIASYNKLPTDKPFHQYLSSGQLFWPGYSLLNPGSGMALSSPTGYKFVISPEIKDYQVTPTNYQTVFETKTYSDYIAAQDIPDCSNPLKAPSGITPTALNAAPSAILAWGGTEFQFLLSSVRDVPVPGMNYYYWKRTTVALAGYNKISIAPFNVSHFNATLSNLGGYFAITELTYLPDTWSIPYHANNACYLSPCGQICDHNADYKVYAKINHFTIQPRTPKEFALICS